MKFYLLILLEFLTLTCFSQDTSKTTDTKWIIGLSGSFNFYKNLKSNAGDNHKYNYTKTGLRGGIELGYRFSKKSSITTGIFFFNIAYTVDYNWAINQPQDPSIPTYTDIKASYIDIPAIYNFNIISREKITFYSAGGIVGSILNFSNGMTIYADNSERKFEYMNSFIFSLQMSLGIQVNLNEKSAIKFEPQYRIFLKGFDSIMYQSPTAICGSIAIIHKINWKNTFKKGAWQPLP